MFDIIANYLIERAKRTPYHHLPGYMNRYWLVPYVASGSSYDEGTGAVSWRRPIAKLLQLCGIAIRVHEILRSDLDRAMHDHPWNYATVILKGGYWEARPAKGMAYNPERADHTWHGAGSVLVRKATDRHYLTLDYDYDRDELVACTTLFITGPWKQTWGFFPDGDTKVPFYTYLGGAPTKGEG